MVLDNVFSLCGIVLEFVFFPNAKKFPRQSDTSVKSAVFLCSEAKVEINAGMIIVTNCRLQRPHLATVPPATMAKGLLGSRQACVRSSCPLPDVDQLASSGLLWTPMWPRPSQRCLSIGLTHGRFSVNWPTTSHFRCLKQLQMEKLFGRNMGLLTS